MDILRDYNASLYLEAMQKNIFKEPGYYLLFTPLSNFALNEKEWMHNLYVLWNYGADCKLVCEYMLKDKVCL